MNLKQIGIWVIGILFLLGGIFIAFLILNHGEVSEPSWRVSSALREVGGTVLRRDAEAMSTRLTVLEKFSPTKIPENLWTDNIRKFKPEHIYMGGDCVRIVTRVAGRYENGIIVYFPSHPDNSLAPGAFAGGGSGGEEIKMDAGIYWFWRKVRSSAALQRKLMEQEGQTNMNMGSGVPVGSPANR